MFANKQTQFGCAQCDADIVRAPVVEFVTRQEMVSFIQSRLLKRFVMIPEFLFYDQFVLSKLESANVAGLVVYPGGSFGAVNESGPSYQKLPSPPVEDLSTDRSEPNLRYNYYPNITVDDDSTPPDYRNPENILENIRKQASGKSLVNVRNAYGTGLKYRFLRYSVFHISEETAAEIRFFFNRFGDTSIIGAQRVTDSDRSPTTPQYQLESIGRMYACPSQTPPPAKSPSVPESQSPSPSISPTPSISATPELDPDTEDTDSDDGVERIFERYPNIATDFNVKAFEPMPSTKDTWISSRQGVETTNPTTTPTELPTTDANICLKDKTCLPIGGQSVWSSLGRLKPRMNNFGKPLDSESEHSVIAVTAPMDSIAFFPDLAFGASAEISSLAVLLAVAEAVGNYWRSLGSISFVYQPVYMALNAQSWGWAGSSRLLKDLSEFECGGNETRGGPGCKDPFMGSLKFFDLRNLSRLNVINIGQLISPNAAENFKLRREDVNNFYFDSIQKSEEYDEKCGKNSLFTDFNDTRIQSGLEDSLFFTDNTGSKSQTLYPLDASQSFRKYYVHNRDDPFDCNFKIISVNNFQVNFTNRYYHSIYDVSNLTTGNSSSFSESSVRQQSEQTDLPVIDHREPMYLMAKVIAKVVAQHAFGEQYNVADPKIENGTIDKVITCMTGNWSSCELKDEYLGQSQFQFPDDKVIPGNYAGSFFPSTRISDFTPSAAAKLALLRHMFAYFNRYDIAAPTSDEFAQSSSEPEDSPLDNDDDNIESSPSPSPGINCTTVSQCADLNKTANSVINHQTEWQNVFCSRETCVLSDTYLHDAFGSAIAPANNIRSRFEVVDDHDPINSTDPEGGSWTESAWDEDLGLCGYVEDTKLYGGLILGTGVVITILTFFVFLYFDVAFFNKVTVSPIEEMPLTTSQPLPP